MTFILLLFKILLGLLAPIVIYLLLIAIGSLIPVNRRFNHQNDVSIYITTNGIHTDYVLPINHFLFDWGKILDAVPYHKDLYEYEYIGIGCGDRGFYLDLPSWSELTFKIAASAMLIPTTRIMHVTAYDKLPIDTLRVERIGLSYDQYVNLCAFIMKGFAQKRVGEVTLIPNVGYTEHDNFYEGTGVYHGFNTCNYWVNEGLKRVGVRTSLWSPLDRGIFYQLGCVK